MARIYNKTRTEEVSPEMCGALDRACRLLGVGDFVRDLGTEVAFDVDGEVRVSRIPLA